ncbi:MAG: hypothetical protein JO263_11675 [Candidatus Eremiobacteraeota bacterium]|nr:hypothetical protein [Candidatus Eremiobacteraeota bacterium]
MRPCFFQPRAIAPLLASALLSACAGHSNALLPPPLPLAPSLSMPMTASLHCKGEKVKKNYARLTLTLSKRKSFCIPAFDGFGGKFEYPSASASPKLRLISSTTNYNHKLPKLAKGKEKPIFYLQMDFLGGTYFGGGPARGEIVGAKLLPGHSYTAFAQGTFYSASIQTKPCWAKAIDNKNGGSIPLNSGLLKRIPGVVPSDGIVEIYPGKHARSKC